MSQFVRRPIAMLFASALAAQSAPAWSDLTGLGPIAGANVQNLGKLAVYQDQGILHTWSAFTRTWTAIAVSANATLRLTNDCLLIRDGTQWTAFSSYSGRFAPLSVSPGAQLVNPSGQDNDSVLLVSDQGSLHAFSGFVGSWVSRAISGQAMVAVQRHVALLADGPTLGGFAAHDGQWHDTVTVTTPLAVTCDGYAGAVESATEVNCFSGIHGTWVRAQKPPGSVRVRNDDWIVWHDGVQATAFSGLRGTVAAGVFGAFALANSEDLFGVFATPAGFVAWSAVTGQFTPVLAAPGATVSTSVGVALFVEPQQVIGFSPTRGTTAGLAITAQVTGVAGVVGYALPSLNGTPLLFSSLTGSWHTPPGDALGGAPLLSTTSALLPTTGGARAFSSRSGAFVPLNAPGLSLDAQASSAPAAAWNTTLLASFDCRTERWITLPRTGTGSPTVQIWRTEMFVVDGNAVHGFGTQVGNWYSTPLPEPWIGGRASSESATVVTNQHVLAFAAVPQTAAMAQFPEFRRASPVGAPLRLQLRLPQGDAAFLAGSVLAPAPMMLPGLGTLLLDPTVMNATFALPDPGQDRSTWALPVPAQPALRGSEWFFQSLVLPTNGAPYLTDAAAVLLL
ncbi:MAG: hypothetical protein IPK26_24165 [Planctomycetes bacterium]|nr:hypothetical protein [Planctomycetota bacterium]